MSVPVLGELETAVLEYLWAHDSADAKALQRDLGRPRGITINTIQSTLERLHRKLLLERERVGHAYRYVPTMSRDKFRATAVAAITGSLRGVAATGALAAFVDVAAEADSRNLDRLEKIIAAARARRGGR